MRVRTKIIGGVAAVAIVAAGVFGAHAVGAQQGGGGGAKDGKFAERVAANLGVTPDELAAAVKDAQLQGVDDALASGRITQEQADKLRERINSSDGLGLRDVIRHHDRMQKVRGAVRQQFVETAAGAIGISAEDLRGELKAGKSIAGVAGEHGVSTDTVKQAILDEAKAKLDQAVAKGRLTQTRADEMYQRLTDNIDTLLTKTRPG